MFAVSGRVCDGKGSQRVGEGGLGNRVGCSGESRRTVGPRVELVPSHGGRNLTRYLRGVRLRRWRRYPEQQWLARQGELRAVSGPTGD